MKNSGLGIASFIISLIAGFGLIALLVAAGLMESSTPGGIDEESPIAVLLGLLMLGFLLVELVAVGLGIGGLCQRDRARTLSVLGTVFSAIAILGVVGLLVLGSLM